MSRNIYQFNKETIINATLPRVWQFFINPQNLQLLTPQEMNFKPCSHLPNTIYKGLKLQYKLKPLWGVPILWETLIQEYNPIESFVDIQTKGPYRLWHHKHTFKAISENETLMIDAVEYTLPLGIVGKTLMHRLVRNKIIDLFNFRTQSIHHHFNT
jgi:ligand-binding SRPBCC domain-containing protein